MLKRTIVHDRAGNIPIGKLIIPVGAGGITWGFFTIAFAFEFALPAAIIASLVALVKFH